MTHLIVKAKTVWHVQLRITCPSTRWNHWFLRHLHQRPTASSITRLGQLCSWAESTWPAIGSQQKVLICDACGPCQMIQSKLKPVFCWFGRIHCVYDLLRCLDLEIWWFSCWQQMMMTDDNDDRQTDYFTSCICVQGNYSDFTLLVWPKVHVQHNSDNHQLHLLIGRILRSHENWNTDLQIGVDQHTCIYYI